MKKGINKKLIIIISLFILLVCIISVVLYINIHGINSKLKIKLNGDDKIVLEVGNKYKDPLVKAYYDKKNISKDIKVKSKLNNKKIGTYKIVYTIKYKKLEKKVTRIIKVVDTTKPVINLEGNDVTIYLGNEYKEPGYNSSDNYDGNITDKVETNNNIDINKVGEYEVTYKVSDSSNNTIEVKRKVNVVERPKISSVQKIAVLNYHFFYDPDIGESCNEGICERVSDFKAQLNYLRDNGYKTLSMKEFRDWMYGEIEIPDKSVLITIDDGAMGTGKHNGNKLIPILEEYKMHATLFLITGWWGIDNYRSNYLDIESHTHDMHTGNLCNASRGAKILCSSDEEVLNDLRTSISITKSKLGFCFPFYAYSEHAISLVQQAGFELAFIGGNEKVSRNTDKYHITRFPIQKTTSLETFISYVN